MKLNELTDNKGARKKGKRVGRGPGSGKGTTAGRGTKGQGSRSGVSLMGFEGGQMPLYRRMPKRGFTSPFRKRYAVINLGTLDRAVEEKKLDATKPVNGQVLKEAGLVTRLRDGIRLLGKGELKAKLSIEVAGASKSAVAAVEKVGGSITVLESKPAAPEAGAEGEG
jgi:large subunit ribosomal protein L15